MSGGVQISTEVLRTAGNALGQVGDQLDSYLNSLESELLSFGEPWGNDDIGQLVRYYMHASKLRFEIGVFRSGIDELRDRERELDAGLAELFTLHERFETTAAGARELIDAQSRLGRAQGDAAGLLVSITYLRDLGQTVEIAIHNLREYEPEKAVDAPAATSPFGRDLRLAKWLADRVGHEIAYLESCRERVGEAQALTDLRLKQLAASHARTAE